MVEKASAENKAIYMPDDMVKALPGIGPKKQALLMGLGINSVRDILTFYPRTYQDRRSISKIGSLKEESIVLLCAKVTRINHSGYYRGRKSVFRLTVGDDTGSINIVFFNASYLRQNFYIGAEMFFYGKVTRDRNGYLQMIHPEFSPVGEEFERGILPVYPLTKGITMREMRRIHQLALPAAAFMDDYIPSEILEENGIMNLGDALINIHYPQDEQDFRNAKYRLVFEELFMLQLGLMVYSNRDRGEGIAFSETVHTEEFVDSLEFHLTGAQLRTISEIEADMEKPVPMNRLVQGDVGSGKTAVAEAALFKASKCGFQGAMMAPTEILAHQHFESLRRDLGALGLKVALLTGSQNKKEKDKVLEDLRNGNTDVIVGTHALIQKGVEFKKLGLVITDEQHRFGVGQRSALGNKGRTPDRLVMTATPIPRTLAVVLYGDMDISIIDEMPVGRKPIITGVYSNKTLELCYGEMGKELALGHQAYAVCPLIQESEDMDILSVEELAEKMKKRFPDRTVTQLHGAMKQSEKDSIMGDFYDGKIDILVSTVVIEVGIDSPNATFMLIVNAERFGLAQLHQLRGRVGRGDAQSYCALVTGDSLTDVGKRRMEIMESTSDGFVIAEEDLNLRGPGELFGTRQHGLPDMHIADIVKHTKIMKFAGDVARDLYREDPELLLPRHMLLKEHLDELFKGGILD